MSIWDYFRRRKPVDAPVAPPKPIVVPTPPIIDKTRANALQRYMADVKLWEIEVKKVKETSIIPPHPPTPDYYQKHPNYVWSKDEPNPELPPPPVVETVIISVFIDGVFATKIRVRKDVSENNLRLIVMNDQVVKTFIVGRNVKVVESSVSDGIYSMTTLKTVEAAARFKADMDRYFTEQKKTPYKRLKTPPPLSYYEQNPDYIWMP